MPRSSLRSSGRSWPGSRSSGSSASERIQRELAPVGHLLHPGVLPRHRHPSQGRDVRRTGSARNRRCPARRRHRRQAGCCRRRVRGAPGDKRLIGLGMIPRGEVGLIFATIGLREGILGGNLYAALLLVVLATTLVTPPLLRWRLARMRANPVGRAESTEPRPTGGWLQISGRVVDLASDPPSRLALLIALDAALAVAAGARPGPKLLDWIGQWSDTPLRWDDEATPKLFAVLEQGDVRAWRFLETTGVLERALPELAEAVESPPRRSFFGRPGAGLALHAGRPDQGDRHDGPCRRDRVPEARPPRVALARGADPRHRRRGHIHQCSSPGGSRNASIWAPRPSRRSRCSSATRSSTAGCRPQARRARGGAGLSDRDAPGGSGAGACALSPHARRSTISHHRSESVSTSSTGS